MARRKRRGGRGMRIGKWVNLIFKGLALGVAASPAIAAVQNAGSNYGAIPDWTLYEYTGYSLSKRTLDPAQTTAGIAALAGAVVIAKIGGFLGRRF